MFKKNIFQKCSTLVENKKNNPPFSTNEMTFYAGSLSRDAEFKQSLLKDPLYTKCQQLSSNYKPEEISIQKTENKEKWIAYNCKKTHFSHTQ
jgi:hypothetical protein